MYEKIEKQLQEQELSFTQVEDDLMETVDYTRSPVSFVRFMFYMSDGNPHEFDYLPTQEDLANHYFDYHKEKDLDTFTEKYRPAWKRRVEVSYTSIVRDIHFYHLLKEWNRDNEIFDTVKYSVELDVEQGVDILIEFEGEEYYLNLYVDTSKANAFVDEKKDHRHEEHDATEIHIPLNPNDAKIVETEGDDVWLYSEDHISQILATVI